MVMVMFYLAMEEHVRILMSALVVHTIVSRCALTHKEDSYVNVIRDFNLTKIVELVQVRFKNL